MNLNFNIFNSLILAGVIQGVIFRLLVLSSKKYNSKSVYFLVALIVTYSFNNLQYYFVDIEALSYSRLFSTFYFPWSDATPPLLYLYVFSYLYPGRKFPVFAKILFVPFVIALIISVYYKLAFWFWPEAAAINAITNFTLNYLAYYADLVMTLFGIAAILSLIITLKRFERAQQQRQFDGVKLHLRWLYTTLAALMGLIILSDSLVIADLILDEEISYYPIWIGIAVLIYWLGHIGVYKYGIDQERKAIQRKRKKLPNPRFDIVKPHPVIARLKTYLIAEKQFLNSDLTLEKTADHLKMSQGHLSKIINNELRVSFSEYVNSLRVEEAKKYLADDAFSDYTLVAIGLEAGFNSKSAFNSSFKKRTGTTPSQFKKARFR